MPLSAQHLLSCNYLNEGCEGGWAIMNGYFAENGALVGEECGKYLGTTAGSPCSGFASCKPVARVEDSYFLGSAGELAIDEKTIQKELMRNGVVVGEFAAP